MPARARLADALGRERVVAQVGEAAEVVEAHRQIHLLEHRGHAAGREAGCGHHLEADAVGFALDVAREVELALQRRCLGAGQDGADRVGIAAPRRREQAEHERRQARQRTPRIGRDAARDMALRDVRHLVAEHRGEFVARRGDGDHAQVDADEAARQREGVDGRVAHEKGFPGETLVDIGGDVAEPARGRDQRVPDGVQILEQQRVVDVVGIGADLAHDLVAQLAFGADREIGRIGIAERWQAVLCRNGLQHRRAEQRERARRRHGAAPRIAKSRSGMGHDWSRRRVEGGRGRGASLSCIGIISPPFRSMTDPDASALTHFDAEGQAHMVDISAKDQTHRVARAGGAIRMRPETLMLIESGSAKKGDVIGVARIAAIQGAKRTAELVPLCHPIAITRIAVEFEIVHEANELRCTAQVETLGRTGVEMEALTAVQIGLLTVYDMCKAVDRGMVIGDVRVLEKRGGKSGDWHAEPTSGERSR